MLRRESRPLHASLFCTKYQAHCLFSVQGILMLVRIPAFIMVKYHGKISLSHHVCAHDKSLLVYVILLAYMCELAQIW